VSAAAERALALVGLDALATPAGLAVGLGLLALGLWLAARRPPDALPWPAWPEAEGAGARRDLGRWLAHMARAAALAALAVALAGPVREHRAPPPPGEGLDLVLVLDASDSMRALDAEIGGEWRTRFALAREVVARFARERAAEGDRVGLVVFGESAFTLCPLASDGALLAAALARAEPGMAGGATALGDALALAVKRVAPEAEDRRARGPQAGRVVVLLTDGRSNTGAVPPDVAAALAAARGVRVHTVGIGTTGEVAMQAPERAGGRGLRFERHDLDEATLAAIAGAAGGRFFAARSSAALAEVYAEIDALERVARRPPPRVRRAPRPEPWLAGAGGLLALELLVGRGLRRRIP
jgi:Ca-activated chloride channel family protein